MRMWAVIGKSFFEEGGQNPAEAIAAGLPVVCGEAMSNFEPLVSELLAVGGIRKVKTREQVAAALKELLHDNSAREKQVEAARKTLQKHNGAVERTVAILRELSEGKS